MLDWQCLCFHVANIMTGLTKTSSIQTEYAYATVFLFLLVVHVPPLLLPWLAVAVVLTFGTSPICAAASCHHCFRPAWPLGA